MEAVLESEVAGAEPGPDEEPEPLPHANSGRLNPAMASCADRCMNSRLSRDHLL